jgi:NADH-quinone oxidoreductase subunit L
MAYSTVSQLGYMVFAVGAGAYIPAIFHLMTHAFFKALLFLGAGSVIHGMHEEQDMRKMGGLRAYMPWTYRTLLAGSLALAGFAGTAGFFSKDEILVGAWLGGYPWAAIIGWIVAFMTAFYTFRMIFMTFHGQPRFDAAHVHPHESPGVMVLPLIALAIPSLFLGLAVGLPPEAGPIHQWLEPAFEHGGGHATADVAGGALSAVGVAAEDGHGPSLALTIGGFAASTLTSLAGIGLAYLMYVKGQISPVAVGRRFAGLYDLFYNKWYIDEIYGAIIVRPLAVLARGLWKWIDAGLIDGIVNGVALLTGGFSQRLRKVQTGVVSNYALAIALGTVIIVGAYIFFGQEFLR